MKDQYLYFYDIKLLYISSLKTSKLNGIREVTFNTFNDDLVEE